jgi:hypothetical protein
MKKNVNSLEAREYYAARILSRSSFEYYGAIKAVKPCDAIAVLNAKTLASIKADIAIWLKGKGEGEGEDRVVEIKHGVLIRIGTPSGQSSSQRRRRPLRNVVAVYNPELNELRVHAKTEEEKRMLRQVFGERLFGGISYFGFKKVFTLRPLLDDKADSLTVTPGNGIDKIVLTELIVRCDDEYDARVCWSADDLFAYAEANPLMPVFSTGRTVKACFEIWFAGQPQPCKVYLWDGDKLQLTEGCDETAVRKWLSAKGFIYR